MSVRADAETYRSIPIFADCDATHLQILAFSAVRQSFAEGDVVIKKGLKGGAAFLILSGRADIVSDGGVRIGSAGPGAMLGEISMIGDIAYSLTARASEPLQAARIDRTLFMRVAQEYPDFGTRVFNALARKLDLSLGDLDSARHAFERAKSFRSLL